MESDPRNGRLVEILTTGGPVRGVLPGGSSRRTLDQLNLASRAFIVVHGIQADPLSGFVADGPLAVNKDAVMFLRETGEVPTQPAGQFTRFTRASVILRVGPYLIRGFMHVPPGGDVMKRLDQDLHPFVALTSALVSGPDTQFTAPFLAVNRHHIAAGQQIGQSELTGSAATSATSSGV